MERCVCSRLKFTRVVDSQKLVDYPLIELNVMFPEFRYRALPLHDDPFEIIVTAPAQSLKTPLELYSRLTPEMTPRIYVVPRELVVGRAFRTPVCDGCATDTYSSD